MINFEQYLLERKGSIVAQPKHKRKVTIQELKQMIANKDPDIADVDVSDITNMRELFEGSDFGGSWTADLSGWDTSNVEDMGYMFSRCSKLKEVELYRTENVKHMNEMFFGCTKLVKVELPNTQNTTEMVGMFEKCSNIKEVNLPNTGNVVDMYGMFSKCSKLTKVLLPSISKVEDMSSMFEYCKELEQDFSSWDITNVKKQYDMFNETKVVKFPKGYEQ